MPVIERHAHWVTHAFKGRRDNVSSPLYQGVFQAAHILSLSNISEHRDEYGNLGAYRSESSGRNPGGSIWAGLGAS